MNNDKDEPLNINYHKRQLSMRRKRRVNSLRKRKDTSNKTFTKINIIIILIFIILNSLIGFLIYKKLNNISELKLAIIEKNQEIESEIKIKNELNDNIKKINTVLNNKEQEVNDINVLYEKKKEEFQNKKKIYENIKETYDKTEKETLYSISLEEAINNLNERINYIQKENIFQF